MSLIAAVNNIVMLSWQLLAQVLRGANPELVKSVHTIRTHLSIVTLSTGNDQQLPEKEAITLNQLSWPETAERMGVKRGKKRRGKVDNHLVGPMAGTSLNERDTQLNCTDQDPYGASELSSKHAKPDAHSATANT
ncbi:hypothetical protein EDB84DRAFT_1443615 [Lactarius hengduanensis]|nr:hypothetical protein EDB84DRAFT_1443615 [Lactarius hengduanensis]